MELDVFLIEVDRIFCIRDMLRKFYKINNLILILFLLLLNY